MDYSLESWKDRRVKRGSRFLPKTCWRGPSTAILLALPYSHLRRLDFVYGFDREPTRSAGGPLVRDLRRSQLKALLRMGDSGFRRSDSVLIEDWTAGLS